MLFLIRKWIVGWFAVLVVLLFCLPLLLFGSNYYFTATTNPVIVKSGDVEIKLEEFRRALTELRQRYRSSNVPLPPEKELRETLLWSLIDGSLVLDYARNNGMRISPTAVADVIRNFESLQQDGIFDRAAYNQVRDLVKQRLGTDIEDNVRAELVPLQLQSAVTLSSFLLEDEVLAIARLKAEKRDFAYATLSLQEAMDTVEFESQQVEQWYEQNEDNYRRPERVKLAYLEIKTEQLQDEIEVDDDVLEAYYNGRTEQYDIEEERRVSHLYQAVPAGDDAAWNVAREKMEELRQRLLDEEAEVSMEQVAEEAAVEEVAEQESVDATAEAPVVTEETAAVEETAEQESVDATDEALAATEETAVDEAAEQQSVDAMDEAPTVTEETAMDETTDDDALAQESDNGETTAASDSDAIMVEPLELLAPGDNEDEQQQEVELPGVEMVTQGLVPESGFMPEIAEVAFVMEVDEISDIVETVDGIHIIRLDEIKEGRVSTFENSREDVENDYREEQAALLYLEKAEELAAMAYENPDNLEDAAEVLDIELQHGEWLEKGGAGVAPLEGELVQTVAFSEEVLTERLNSELLELSPEHSLVLRVEEHEPTSLKEFSEVEQQAEQDLRRDLASSMVNDRGEEVLLELRDESTGDDIVAEDNDFTWEHGIGLERDSQDAPRNVLREVFRMTPPAEGEYIYLGKVTGSGDYLLIRLDAVHPVSDDSDIAEEEINAVWEEYAAFVQQRDWGLFMKALRADSEVEIFHDRIDEALGAITEEDSEQATQG